MSYYFHPAAEAEHLESVAYFESKRPGLGASYLAEFEKVMDTVCKAPHRHPIEKQPDIRRIRMKRFPFFNIVQRIIGLCSSVSGCSYPTAPTILARQDLTMGCNIGMLNYPRIRGEKN